MTEWDLAYMRREVKPAPAAPLSDAEIDRIADDVPVDQIGVHITTWHRRFARAFLSAAPAVPHPDEFVCPYCFDQMHAHAAAVSAERDAEIAGMRETLQFIAGHDLDGADDMVKAIICGLFIIKAKEALATRAALGDERTQMSDLLLHNLCTIGTHHCDGTVGKEAADEIERLREQLHLAEVARAAQVEGLTAGLDALRVDAERYRYLRDIFRRDCLLLRGPEAGVWCDCEDEHGELVLLTEGDLDAAIDAALAARKGAA